MMYHPCFLTGDVCYDYLIHFISPACLASPAEHAPADFLHRGAGRPGSVQFEAKGNMTIPSPAARNDQPQRLEKGTPHRSLGIFRFRLAKLRHCQRSRQHLTASFMERCYLAIIGDGGYHNFAHRMKQITLSRSPAPHPPLGSPTVRSDNPPPVNATNKFSRTSGN